MGKLNSMAGGGKESEKNEDYLDKGSSLPYRPSGTRELTDYRCRLRPGTARSRRPEQRECHRAGQG